VKFVDACSAQGFNLVEFPEIMPAYLMDSKFVEQDWMIKKPGTDEPFVLTPEITAFYASLIGQNTGIDALKNISYVATCYRENRFVQLGLESISSNVESDVRVISTAYDFLESLGLADYFEIVVNDLSQLKRFVSDVGVDKEYVIPVLKILDKYSGIIRAGTTDIDEAFTSEVSSYVSDAGVRKELLNLAKSNQYDKEFSSEFKEILSDLSDKKNLRVGASLARGLSYYNSLPPRESTPIFEIYSKTDLEQICGGGRYDGLMGRLNPKLQNTEFDSGIGFAFGLERVFKVLMSKYQSFEKMSEVLR